jgi:hypothetical protein
MSLDDWADITIIIVGGIVILLTIAQLIVFVTLGWVGKSLLTTVRTLINEDVRPITSEARDTAKRVAGTTTFMSETTVRPVIRTYGIVAGTRRAFAVLAGFTTRRNKEEQS